ncbi:hypothetical protein T4C_10295 [Trichinella pseudospiralis]|uniref:Uncharacterized protein n=1 Tax=Trichinella pseudospiralis TaxID=6337 RepID=A0A0V1IUB2_TRIPS|nr:hypothetical protein T4C_10295 [Trichinella pseudospiralis]
MRFPVGPNSVSLGLGYFKRVKLSHIVGLSRSKIYVCNLLSCVKIIFDFSVFLFFPNNFLFFYFIQFAFLHFHTSYFVNFFQQIFYYDSFILTLTLKKTDT